MKRDLEGHFIILRRRIHQEDTNIINIYGPNIGAPKYIRKILEDFKKDIDSNKLIVGDFNNPLSTRDRVYKQNTKKDIVAMNDTLNQMDLTDTYRTFHPKESKYTLISNAHGTFSFSFFKLLLLFNYSCVPFLPIPPPHPCQTHLPPPPPPSPLILFMCPL